jgi:hypothetical protein
VSDDQRTDTSRDRRCDRPRSGLDRGLAYYRDQLGHEVIWRNDDLGQVALRLPASSAELVLTTHSYEANWLVNPVPQAVAAMVTSGGRVILRNVRSLSGN